MRIGRLWDAYATIGTFQTRGEDDGPYTPDTSDDDSGGSGQENCVAVSFIFTLFTWLVVVDTVWKRVRKCFKKGGGILGFLKGLVCVTIGIVVTIVVTVLLVINYFLLTVYICGKSPRSRSDVA